jgi:purine-binding chemotaxis protein CheW
MLSRSRAVAGETGPRGYQASVDLLPNGGQFVVFDLGGEEYALPIQSVREVVRYTRPRRVSGDARLLGVVCLRDKLVPVVDVAQRLGLEVTLGEDSRIVVIATGETTSAGVVVDGVNEVITLRGEDIEALPASDNEILGSIAQRGDRLLMLLDAERIFHDVAIGAPAVATGTGSGGTRGRQSPPPAGST